MAARIRFVEMGRDPGNPERRGKFVHLQDPQGTELVVAAPYEAAGYHAEIVAAFLEERGIQTYVLAPGGDWCEVYAPGWRVLGGGHYRLDEAGGILELGGSSQAFGGCDHGDLIQRLSLPACRVFHSDPPFSVQNPGKSGE